MDIQSDIGEVVRALEAEGRPVLVEAILIQVKRARVALGTSQGLAQTDKLLDTICDCIAGKADKKECDQERIRLIASEGYRQPNQDTQAAQVGFYYYQSACVELARLLIDDQAIITLWVVEELAKFWHAWMGSDTDAALITQLSHLEIYLERHREAKRIDSLTPEAIEARSRRSTLAC